MTMYRRDYIADIKRTNVLEPVWVASPFPEPPDAVKTRDAFDTKPLEVFRSCCRPLPTRRRKIYAAAATVSWAVSHNCYWF